MKLLAFFITLLLITAAFLLIGYIIFKFTTHEKRTMEATTRTPATHESIMKSALRARLQDTNADDPSHNSFRKIGMQDGYD